MGNTIGIPPLIAFEPSCTAFDETNICSVLSVPLVQLISVAPNRLMIVVSPFFSCSLYCAVGLAGSCGAIIGILTTKCGMKLAAKVDCERFEISYS